MTTFRTAVMTIVALGAATQVWAAEPPRNQTAQLAQAKKDVARVSGNARGAHRQLLQLEQLKLQGLIDDLQSGKHVDPAAIDRALRDAERDAR